MTELQSPLTPAECDLRGLPFMPLDTVRLLDSDLFALASGDEFKAAVSLWCKSWLQKPAGSLPDDDRVLAHLSAAGSQWQAVKEMALRGWVRCSDGRLYHPVVAEKAKSAWTARLAQRERTEAARFARAQARKHAADTASGSSQSGNGDSDKQRTQDATEPASPSVTDTVTTSVTDSAAQTVTGSKGEGEGEGEYKKEKKEGSLRSPTRARTRASAREERHPDTDFEVFWLAYPRKEGKGAARKAYERACKQVDHAALLAAIRRQPWDCDPRFIPHPATWLNQQRWNDRPVSREPPSLYDRLARIVGLDQEATDPHQPPEDFDVTASPFTVPEGLLQ